MARPPQLSNQLQIDQATLSPTGTPGKARTDGKAGGQLVTLTNTGTGTTTRFRLLDVPLGDTTAALSLAATGSPKVWTFTPTASVYGSYRIELTEDLGLSTEYTEVRIFGIRTPAQQLLLPALNQRGDPSADLLHAGATQIANAEDNSDDSPIAAINGRRYASWLRSIWELFLVAENGASAATLAGNGLSAGGGALNVNVDGSTIAIAADTLGVPSSGIGATQLAAGSVTSTKLGAAAVTTTAIADANVTNAKLANVGADTFKGNITGSPAAPSDNNLSALAGTGLSFTNHQLTTAATGSANGYLSKTEYVTTTTWATAADVPPGNQFLILLDGPGGGGGSGGQSGTPTTSAAGGAGGGGGARKPWFASRAQLVAMLPIVFTLPAGGAGGAARTLGTNTAQAGLAGAAASGDATISANGVIVLLACRGGGGAPGGVVVGSTVGEGGGGGGGWHSAGASSSTSSSGAGGNPLGGATSTVAGNAALFGGGSGGGGTGVGGASVWGGSGGGGTSSANAGSAGGICSFGGTGGGGGGGVNSNGSAFNATTNGGAGGGNENGTGGGTADTTGAGGGNGADSTELHAGFGGGGGQAASSSSNVVITAANGGAGGVGGGGGGGGGGVGNNGTANKTSGAGGNGGSAKATILAFQ